MEKSITLRRQATTAANNNIRREASILPSNNTPLQKIEIASLNELFMHFGAIQRGQNIFEIGEKQFIINEETFYKMHGEQYRSNLRKFKNNVLNQSVYTDRSITSHKNVHLAYLFASPLVIHTSGDNYWEGLPAISFRQEFVGIIEKIEESNTEFKCCYQMATEENLNYCLGLKPIGLHFSGHGFENNQLAFSKDRGAWERDKHKGDFLMFEQENGASKNMYSSLLKEILGKYDCKAIKFVIIASCYSLCFGQIFSQAGVDHVICIDKGKEIDDKAALTFSRAFYKALYTSGRTICEAYEMAKEAVKRESPIASKKFKKLPEECNHCNSTQELKISKSVFRRKQGIVEILGELPLIYKIPSRVEPFLFRNRDMFEVLNLMQQEPNIQVVQVYAMIPGTGKSSLLRNLTNHIFERNLYKNGVLYFNLNKCQNASSAFEILIRYLNSFRKNLIRNNKKAKSGRNNFGYEPQKDQASSLAQLLSFFNDKQKLLIVLDNLNFLQPSTQDCDLFIETVNTLTHDVKNLHILFSTNFYIKDIDNMRVKRLNMLAKDQPFELFIKKIPCDEARLKLEDMSAIRDLHDYTLTLNLNNTNPIGKPCQVSHNHSQQCLKLYLNKHPLLDRLGGHPLAISIVASMLVNMSLTEVFRKLMEASGSSKSAMILTNKGDLYEETLLQSLEMSFNQLKKRDHKCIDIFLLIGLSHDGLTKESLLEIFEESACETPGKTEDRLKILAETSFIQNGKILDLEIYRVPYLVDFFIEQKLESKAKYELYIILASHFNRTIKSLIDDQERSEYAQELALEQKILQFLERHAPDITMCLDFLFEQDLSKTQNNELTPKISRQSINFANQSDERGVKKLKQLGEKKISLSMENKDKNSVRHKKASQIMVTVGKLGEETSTPVHFSDIRNLEAHEQPVPHANKLDEEQQRSQKYAHITSEYVDSSSSQSVIPNNNNCNSLDISTSLLNFRETKNNNNYFDSKAIVLDNKQLLGANLLMTSGLNLKNQSASGFKQIHRIIKSQVKRQQSRRRGVQPPQQIESSKTNYQHLNPELYQKQQRGFMGGTGGNGGQIFSPDSSESNELLSSSQFESIANSDFLIDHQNINSQIRKQSQQNKYSHNNTITIKQQSSQYEEPLNNLKYKDDLQAFIIHAQITKAFNKSEEGSLEGSNGIASNHPTIIIEETKPIFNLKYTFYQQFNNNIKHFQRMLNLTQQQSQQQKQTMMQHIPSPSSGAISSNSQVITEIMEVYGIKKQHRPYLERLQTKISEFKCDIKNNHEEISEQALNEELAKTNSMLVRFQTIRKDQNLSKFTSPKNMSEVQKAQTQNLDHRLLKFRNKSKILSQITQSDLSSIVLSKQTNRNKVEQIETQSKRWMRRGSTGEELKQIMNPSDFSSAELLLINFLKLQFMLYKEDYKIKNSKNDANNDDQSAHYNQTEDHSYIDDDNISSISAAIQSQSISRDQELIKIIDKYYEKIRINHILKSEVDQMRTQLVQSQTQNIERWRTFVRMQSVHEKETMLSQISHGLIQEEEQEIRAAAKAVMNVQQKRTSNPRIHPEAISGLIQKPQQKRVDGYNAGSIDLVFPQINPSSLLKENNNTNNSNSKLAQRDSMEGNFEINLQQPENRQHAGSFGQEQTFTTTMNKLAALRSKKQGAKTYNQSPKEHPSQQPYEETKEDHQPQLISFKSKHAFQYPKPDFTQTFGSFNKNIHQPLISPKEDSSQSLKTRPPCNFTKFISGLFTRRGMSVDEQLQRPPNIFSQ